MKNLTQYILYITLTAAAACGESGIDEPEKPKPGPVEVTFTTEVRTRVQREDVVTGFRTGDAMTLYRVAEGSAPLASVRKIACAEGVWRGAPAVMLEPERTASFQAAYPFLPTAADPAAYPVSMAAQTDYLYSGPAVAVQPDAPRAKLTMRHAQAILAFNIRSYVGGELRGVGIDDQTLPLEGTMNLTDGRIAVTRRGSYAFDCPRNLSEEGWTTGHPACFIFPQAVSDGQTALRFRIDGGEYSVPIPAMTFEAGNKYILDLSLTAQGIVLHPERTEVVSLDAGGGTAGDPYGSLRVTHRNGSCTVPHFTGSALYGVIYWDEATAEPFAPGATHSYAGDGPHTAVFDLWRAEGVRFSDLEGIERIDLSQFR